ncbi:MAG: hypothetical protein KatS3mg103_0224 [Phycisphaerales bacterium]|nr:MAG: hypothetical protein KatS3mg103_0224 [Phycisphaerales bacterium]
MGESAYTILIVGDEPADADAWHAGGAAGPDGRAPVSVEFCRADQAEARAQSLRQAGHRVLVAWAQPAEAGIDGQSGDGRGAAARPASREGVAKAEHVDQAYALLDAINEGVCLLRPDGSIVWANAFFRTLDPAIAERIRNAARDSLSWLQEQRLRRSRCTTRNVEVGDEDSDCWYEVVISLAPQGPASPAADAAGGCCGDGPRGSDGGEGSGAERVRSASEDRLVVVVRDVSEARRMDRKMSAIEQAGRDLVSIDSEFVRSKNAMERLGVLESRIIETAHKLLNFDHFAIRLINEKTGKLDLVISEGLSPQADELDLYPSRTGNGIAGYVASTGVSEISNDAAHDSRFLPCLQGAASALVVPLRLHDRVIGVLDVESLKPGAFNEEDRRFAELFARHIALALRVLDLLVVERCETNATVSDRMAGELQEPLEDIAQIVEQMRASAEPDSEHARRLKRIAEDVQSIRDRMRRVAEGPRSLLGVERAMSSNDPEPLIEGRRILVADDEPAVRRVIADVLRNRGATVEVCQSGAEAIEALQRATQSGERFDLVISDIKMPDRNGYEVFSAARRALPDVPVILMTGFGYDPSHSIVRASQEGLRCVLFKPFQVQRLLEETRAALAGPDQPGDTGPSQAGGRATDARGGPRGGADSRHRPNHQTA